MTRTGLWFAVALLPAFAGGLPTAVAAQQVIGAQADWCQIDDPAAWDAARQKLIDAGVRDLGSIPCPERETGARVPIVLTLPMPCGRAMVFQRVDVPASHPLDQVDGHFGRSVDIEAETPQTVLSNGAWNAPVSGAYSITEGQVNGVSDTLDQLVARAYYMARYELTEVQWQIFRLGLFDLPVADTATPESPACAPLEQVLSQMNLRLVPAQGGLSWFDAVSFSRGYSNWLITRDVARIAEGQRPDLPWEQGTTGYVRLPTEAEWEYAARGGASQVTAQARSIRLPTILQDDGKTLREAKLAEVCADKPQAQGVFLGGVGRKAPNALGLYDVVCNAEEIVLDLFRPTRPDGLSGQVGGVITKGGTSALFRENNTVGRRTEAAALFNLSGEGSTPSMGTRMAVAAPVFSGRRDSADDARPVADIYATGRSNEPYEQALMEGRARLLQSGVGLVRDQGQGEELAAEVNKLRRSLSEGQLTQQQLTAQAERLQIELERLETRLGAEARSATLLTIRTGVVTSNLIDRMGRNVYNALVRIAEYEETPNLDRDQRALLASFREALRINEDRIQASFDLYLQVQTELGARNGDFVSRQIAASRSGVDGVSVDVFGDYLDRFEQHHQQVRDARGRLTEQLRNAWLDEVDTTRARRRLEFPRLQR